MTDVPRRRAPEPPALAGAVAPEVPGPMAPGLEGPGQNEHRAASPPAVPQRYIPRLLVLPEVAAPAGADAPPLDGAHRFPAAPTPVLRASLGLLGYAVVDWARRPMRAHLARYRFARYSPATPSGQAAGALRSGRFPKV